METWIILILVLAMFLLGYGYRDYKIKTSKCFGELLYDKKRERFRMQLGTSIDLDNMPKTTTWVVLKIDPNADLPDEFNNGKPPASIDD